MTDRLAFLNGGGAATQLILDRDWTGHPLGPPQDWPEALKTALSLVLNSPESMILSWGEDLIFFFNETYFPLLGPRLSWAMGDRFDRVWADGWAQAKPIIDDAFAGEAKRFVDLPWKLATDRGAADTWFTFSYSRVLDADGKVAGLFILTNETTGRVLTDRALVHAQAALEAQNLDLERAVQTRTAELDRAWRISQELLVVVTPDGFFERVNARRWNELLGWSEAELTGARFSDFTHPDDLAVTEAALSSLAERPLTDPHTYRFRHADGSYRWFSWTAALEAGLIYASGRDVTLEREQADALRQSQKMEAVGQLTGGLAHDFNNLLAGISGSLEMLQKRLAQGRMADVDRYVTAAQGAAKRAAALTHRLLAFSRRQTLAPKATDVDGLVRSMAEMIRRTVGPAITVDVVGTAGLWTVLVDPSQLENALLNLCLNARDAMPDGGSIVIRTANERLDRVAAAAQDLPAGEYLSLSVRDTGSGMTPQVIASAFEPFFTTKPVGEGTGLGLSMIYGFAQQSGGQVRIRSAVGAGSTVCIYLPRHDGEAEAAAPAELYDTPLAESGETVLVVDDEPTVRMLIVDVLRELGYVALEATDSLAGLRLLRSDARIDLLITDVGLPGGMNGRQMADAARESRPDLKVLFITGYAETAAFGADRLTPGMEVLTKPFVVDALAARIRDVIAG